MSNVDVRFFKEIMENQLKFYAMKVIIYVRQAFILLQNLKYYIVYYFGSLYINYED